VLALLEETRLIHDEQTAIRLAQVVHDIVAQVVAHALHIPDRPIEQALDALRPTIADRLSHLPTVLALDALQEAEHIALRPLAHFRAGKAVRDAPVELRHHLRPSRPWVVGRRDAAVVVAHLHQCHEPAPSPYSSVGEA
jgi:hypothetical protein